MTSLGHDITEWTTSSPGLSSSTSTSTSASTASLPPPAKNRQQKAPVASSPRKAPPGNDNGNDSANRETRPKSSPPPSAKTTTPPGVAASMRSYSVSQSGQGRGQQNPHQSSEPRRGKPRKGQRPGQGQDQGSSRGATAVRAGAGRGKVRLLCRRRILFSRFSRHLRCQCLSTKTNQRGKIRNCAAKVLRILSQDFCRSMILLRDGIPVECPCPYGSNAMALFKDTTIL